MGTDPRLLCVSGRPLPLPWALGENIDEHTCERAEALDKSTVLEDDYSVL